MNDWCSLIAVYLLRQESVPRERLTRHATHLSFDGGDDPTADVPSLALGFMMKTWDEEIPREKVDQ